MSEDIRQPELTALESALTALKPSGPGLDHDQLMFRAGQESARRRVWPWTAATAALALAAAGFGGLLVARPTVRQIVYVDVAKSDPPTAVVRQETPEPVVRPPSVSRERAVARSDYLRPWVEMLEGKATPRPAPALYPAPAALSLPHLLDLPPGSLDRVSRSRLERAFLRTGEPL